ncbi:MAG TPA: hypothetical protein VGB71_15600, partial [Flavisolibacter sp.]
MKKPILSFVKAIGLLSIVVTGYTAKATNYYFSSSNGDDSRTQLQAQSSSTPWKSLEKLNAIFQSLRAGDSIFFKRGDVFTGTIAPSASGNSSAPIVLTAYGAGEQPVISGFQNVSGWKAVGGKIWEADGLSANELNVVLVNGKVRPVGRYPNEGYLSIDSYSGNSSITDGQLASGPNWNGGDVVIRKNRWILDRNKITNHSGNTVSYISESGYHASANYGYFIQNHPNTLDQEGEWYFQNKKIGVYINGGSPSSYSVQASVVPVLINLSSQSNLTFLGLRFTGANNTAFEIR